MCSKQNYVVLDQYIIRTNCIYFNYVHGNNPTSQIDGLVQDRSNSNTLATELLRS